VSLSEPPGDLGGLATGRAVSLLCERWGEGATPGVGPGPASRAVRVDVLGGRVLMLNNQRMDSADQRALLLAALGRTLAAAAAAGINDPKLAELLATGLAQHQELTAGTGPDDVDRRSTCSGGPGQRLRSSAELPGDETGPWLVTISGLDDDQHCRRDTLLEARCAVDGAALLEGLRTRDCQCDWSDVHGTLLDDQGSVVALYDIMRERP